MSRAITSHRGVIEQAGATLLLDGQIVGDLPEPCNQGLQALLLRARQRGRGKVLGGCEAGDHRGIDPVGLLQDPHCLGITTYAARIGQGTRQACLPQLQERATLVTAACFHCHQLHRMLATKDRQPGDPGRIVVETVKGAQRIDADIKPCL